METFFGFSWMRNAVKAERATDLAAQFQLYSKLKYMLNCRSGWKEKGTLCSRPLDILLPACIVMVSRCGQTPWCAMPTWANATARS